MGAMGWFPSDFWSATPWDFWRALAGWKRRNGIEDNPKRNEEMADLKDWMAEEMENERRRGLR